MAGLDRMVAFVGIGWALWLMAGAAAAAEHGSKPEADVPARAEDVRPLNVGQTVPSVMVRDLEGRKVDLADRARGRWTLLIFYRGGWCIYCNAHWGRLAGIEDRLLQLGIRLVAVSPDRPERLRKTRDRYHLNFQFYSDAPMEAARRFGLAFRVDEETLAKYREYGIDLEAASGYRHHELPVPAAFVIDPTGVIRYRYFNPDYKVRVDPERLWAVVQALVGGG